MKKIFALTIVILTMVSCISETAEETADRKLRRQERQEELAARKLRNKERHEEIKKQRAEKAESRMHEIKFVVFYPNYPDTLIIRNKRRLAYRLYRGASEIVSVSAVGSSVEFESTAPIKVLSSK